MSFFAKIALFFAGDAVKKVLALIAAIIPQIVPLVPEHTVVGKILSQIMGILIALGLLSGGTSGLRSNESREQVRALVKEESLPKELAVKAVPELAYDPLKMP